MNRFTQLLHNIFIACVLLAQPIGAQTLDDQLPGHCRRGVIHPHVEGQHPLRIDQQEEQQDPSHYIGLRRQLVVMAKFADMSFVGDQAATLQQWDKIFNQVNLTESPFVGSVHDYFYHQSYGQLDLQFDLYYVTLSSPHGKYGSTMYGDENSKYLVHEVADILNNQDIDWSLYDWNDDRYIDQIIIICPGKGSSYGGFGGDNKSIWPHQWWLSQHIESKAHPVGHDGQYLIDSYCAFTELSKSNDYGSFGIICHEYSHCFGLPDFYYGGSNKVLGYWDLMDSGCYSDGGFRPVNYSAHERMCMGWMTPTELTEPTTITEMPALSDEPKAYLVRNENYANEYYIIENRQHKGWDQALPNSGIVVFHVEYDYNTWTSPSGHPNDGTRKRYHIIPANNYSGVSQSAGWAYPYADNDELTNTSKPAAMLNLVNVDGTYFMSKPITDMSVDDGLASFTFMYGTIDIASAQVKNEPSKELYRFGNVSIVRMPNGDIRKVIKK